MERRVVVVGGGLSGLACAALTAEAGFPTVLVEKTARLGGNALSVMRSWRGLDVSAEVERLKKRLGESHLAQVLTESTVQAIHGPTGKFSVLVQSRRSGTVESFQAGAVVIATGAREARPSGHLYGEHPGVLTHQDLDRMLMEGDEKGLEEAKCLVFIQCVGSCDDGRPYCSRVCCTHSVTRAVYLKERFPRLDIYILYKHMRTYGQRDEYFRRARRMGIRIVRFGHGSPPRLTTVTGLDRSLRPVRRLKVECSSELLDSDLVIHPDYVILASAIEPDAENNQSLSALLKLPLGPDGFFQEGHPKLRPAELRRDGFFVAGLAHYPKEVEESLSQAAAAASKAMAFVSKGETTLDRHTAVVFPELCDGCALCIDVCKEQAVSLVEFVFGSQVKAMAEIDDSICTGCGACVAVCPKYALGIPDYMPDEMAAQINFLLGEEYET